MKGSDFDRMLKETLTPKEYQEIEMIAFEEVQRLARDGNSEAQFQLGCWYFLGDYVKKSYEKAFYWFEKAAGQGDERALKVLKMCNAMEDN